MQLMAQVFEPVDAVWRGLGTIAGSGLESQAGLGLLDGGLRRQRVQLGRTAVTATNRHGAGSSPVASAVRTSRQRRINPAVVPASACRQKAASRRYSGRS